MYLNPKDFDKLQIFTVGILAKERKERGLKLNYTETMGYLAYQLHEMVRDGDKTVTDLMNLGTEILSKEDVMEGVAEMIPMIQIEGSFPDGTKLVSVERPIR